MKVLRTYITLSRYLIWYVRNSYVHKHICSYLRKSISTSKRYSDRFLKIYLGFRVVIVQVGCYWRKLPAWTSLNQSRSIRRVLVLYISCRDHRIHKGRWTTRANACLALDYAYAYYLLRIPFHAWNLKIDSEFKATVY